MLDTSYGFNNLLKEVQYTLLRDTNISQASNKSFLKISLHAKTSVPRSKDHWDPLVSQTSMQKSHWSFLSAAVSPWALEIDCEPFAIFKSF